MPKLIDQSGKRFGRLVVVKRAANSGRTTRWECRCDCGNVVIVRQPDLHSGRTQSCGCIHREQLADRNRTHNLSYTRLCSIWRAMKGRCYNTNSQAYPNYGGRGITVCDEWKNDLEAFYAWAIANGYDEHLSIDRIDVNGNYEPSNCRWADKNTQANNTRNNRVLECDGKQQTIAQWSKETGIKAHTIRRRLELGWTIEKALKTP